MTFRYLSVCSGIEAASVAWEPLGWQPVAFSEIEPFASAVLAHRFPNVPNFGDMTAFKDWPDATFDVLVGGTPCQSFSVAGLRSGMDDPRGNLALTYLAIADRYRPSWLVWENVPGVLSSNRGRDFGSIIGGMVKLGYGVAYRVLDAQFMRTRRFRRAVPQRRRRVFVVGYLGDWRCAAAVLFDRESLSGHPPPRREAGKGTSHDVAVRLVSSGRGVERAGETRGQDPIVAVAVSDRDVAGAMSASGGTDRKHGWGWGQQAAEEGYVVPVAFGGNDTRGPIEVATAIRAKGGTGHGDFESETFVAWPLTAGMAASAHRMPHEQGALIPVAPLPFDTTQITSKANYSSPKAGDPSHPLTANGDPPTIAFQGRGSNIDVDQDVTGTLGTNCDRASGGAPCIVFDSKAGGDTGFAISDIAGALHGEGRTAVSYGWAVRRLTPLECERLQGFPEGWTDVPYRKRNWTPDGPRYRALSNSMAVPCMEWIGERISRVAGLQP